MAHGAVAVEEALVHQGDPGVQAQHAGGEVLDLLVGEHGDLGARYVVFNSTGRS
ncbi:hypothetical protein [Lentzea sp. E54]|uniref:hypothetical protein n=1 Tax=Lentzea xerophila TaxID=3435883 RepID=UPI003DA5BE7A